MPIDYHDAYDKQKSINEALEGAVKNGVRRDNEKNRLVVDLKAHITELKTELSTLKVLIDELEKQLVAGSGCKESCGGYDCCGGKESGDAS